MDRGSTPALRELSVSASASRRACSGHNMCWPHVYPWHLTHAHPKSVDPGQSVPWKVQLDLTLLVAGFMIQERAFCSWYSQIQDNQDPQF